MIKTSEEFNTKYLEYLEEGNYGLDIDIPAVVRYLDKIFQGLTKIPGFKYSQIKEKFYQGRFYTNLDTIVGNPLDRIISNEVERKITMLLESHSDYIKYNQNESNVSESLWR
jgi:hypothetical protein